MQLHVGVEGMHCCTLHNKDACDARTVWTPGWFCSRYWLGLRGTVIIAAPLPPPLLAGVPSSRESLRSNSPSPPTPPLAPIAPPLAAPPAVPSVPVPPAGLPASVDMQPSVVVFADT